MIRIVLCRHDPIAEQCKHQPDGTQQNQKTETDRIVTQVRRVNLKQLLFASRAVIKCRAPERASPLPLAAQREQQPPWLPLAQRTTPSPSSPSPTCHPYRVAPRSPGPIFVSAASCLSWPAENGPCVLPLLLTNHSDMIIPAVRSEPTKRWPPLIISGLHTHWHPACTFS